MLLHRRGRGGKPRCRNWGRRHLDLLRNRQRRLLNRFDTRSQLNGVRRILPWTHFGWRQGRGSLNYLNPNPHGANPSVGGINPRGEMGLPIDHRVRLPARLNGVLRSHRQERDSLDDPVAKHVERFDEFIRHQSAPSSSRTPVISVRRDVMQTAIQLVGQSPMKLNRVPRLHRFDDRQRPQWKHPLCRSLLRRTTQQQHRDQHKTTHTAPQPFMVSGD